MGALIFIFVVSFVIGAFKGISRNKTLVHNQAERQAHRREIAKVQIMHDYRGGLLYYFMSLFILAKVAGIDYHEFQSFYDEASRWFVDHPDQLKIAGLLVSGRDFETMLIENVESPVEETIIDSITDVIDNDEPGTQDQIDALRLQLDDLIKQQGANNDQPGN